MVNGRDSFLRYDLVITREGHEQNMASGVYPEPDRWAPELTIRQEDVPTYKDLKTILEKVGGPYGWDRRKEFQDRASIKHISDKLAEPTSKRFSFWAAGRNGLEEVGGTIIANIEPKVSRIIEKAETKGHLNLTHEQAENSIEIYKIGLFPEFTNKGWGKHFVPQVLQALFTDVSHPSVVYLNTRSTNHNGVISFYRSLNMHVIHAENYPDDLIPEAEIQPRRPAASRRVPSSLKAAHA